ncbi:uncharacterized protein HMPREF1541_07528 [Cyphellophora europaea CBS 101466]|uniref:RING-type domain-containing protein n=1 Tax=Cyphellophora europaea (strain CBS 101466) TaxID=1220924 RepID=W2RNM4_CYPE1|nr:uncharacterized protein HMPREF1541_07528 [Cyphellophora europaea CBS 101466]ETN37905.1 hypothetical protein HMPREF1541_07528 [Cyphellophora europaea CBS 101466]
MKFGQDFQAALRREEFPREWIDSAISYKKLKKCIKRVQNELLSLGLDQETLNALWQHVNTQGELAEGDTSAHRMLRYTINGSEQVKFTPKLTVAIDPRDGSPMDAWLSPETRRHLRRFSRNSRPSISEESSQEAPKRRRTVCERQKDQDLSNASLPQAQDATAADTETGDTAEASANEPDAEPEDVETIEIPLTSDSEFFQILRRELKTLEDLQAKEQRDISGQITLLATELQNLKLSKKKRSKQEVEAWRKLFELYTDSEIFRSSHEIDAGARDVSLAQAQLKNFTKSVVDQRVKRLLTTKEGNAAMDRFLKINVDLLRLMRFQEMNRLALTKIMKKFDKRTALHARAAVPDSLKNGSAVSQDLAKATCYTIANELLSVIPQINDYLCPICFSITYKPVRLACNHIFCIRCLIIMQREEQGHCPLCREECVMQANSDNVDAELMKFLEKNFKAEVKEKQRANELAAALDRFGEPYLESPKCAVM